jgi:molybdenum cofactor synthesis domain-containing protein
MAASFEAEQGARIMTEPHPLTAAQRQFVESLPFRSLRTEPCPLEEALGRVLARPVAAPVDLPPYHRVIVEGYLIHSEDSQSASEDNPVTFRVVGTVMPGDRECPAFGRGEALQVATGSIAPDGPVAVARMFEVRAAGEDRIAVTRPFPPRFFIEERGCDLEKDAEVAQAGRIIDAPLIGSLAALGIGRVEVMARPRVTIYASGNEVVPYTDVPAPGEIRDSNSIMLAAAVQAAGGIPEVAGIMRDDFEAFVSSVNGALSRSDMVVISGGTAVGGRDFISDLVRSVGDLVVDGVPMRSGRPLIMGHAGIKPIVCVAGHPPEALRGFRLFGVAAIDRLLGREAELPADA